jgi:signal transduction histidine kinase
VKVSLYFIIRNLIANAIKYTYSGGSIGISADRQSKPGYTVFTVTDTGVGMDMAVMARIFLQLIKKHGWN